MFAAATVSVVILSLVRLGRAFEPTAFKTGTCEEYPADGVCAPYGFAGLRVFKFDGEEDWITDFTKRDEAFASFIIPLESVASSLAGPICVQNYFFSACTTWYPPCSDADTPRRLCQSSCQQTLDLCKGAYDVAKQTSLYSSVMQCEDTVGGERSQKSSLYVNFLEGWKDQPSYESLTYTDPATGREEQCIDSSNLGVSCSTKKCREPLVSIRMPKRHERGENQLEFEYPGNLTHCTAKNADGNWTNELDCEKCTSSCALPCPYPFIYTDGEQSAQKLVQWLPGLLGFPLNLLVVFAEMRKLFAMKKTDITDQMVLFSGLLGLVLFFIDALPALVLGSDLKCNGFDFFGDLVNDYGHSFCTIGQLKSFVLISLMATVVCNLNKIYNQLEASKKMKKYKPGSATRAMAAFLVFLLPAVLAVIAVSIAGNNREHASVLYRNREADNRNYTAEQKLEYGKNFKSLYNGHAIRNQYSCSVFFDTIEAEVQVVYVPTILLSIIACLQSAALLATVYGMQKNGSKKGKNEALIRLAINMLRFAGCVIILSVASTISAISYLSASPQFAAELNDFTNCLNTGINQKRLRASNGTADVNSLANTNYTLASSIEVCDDIRLQAPKMSEIVFLNLTTTLPPLLFGLVFAYPSIKLIQKNISSRIGSSVSPSSASSTN